MDKNKQHRPDQVPTITEKSSGLEYVKASMEPAQESRVQSREPVTKNDKG